ncbi:MAG: hypothetical protein JSS07_10050 [Proteobacteria bacterium]|nr:hypothetical protein [Pseudomonadota bacterium]
MLTFVENLDEKLYRLWKIKAQKVINPLREAMNKINFGQPEPLEVQKIRQALVVLQNEKKLSQKEYVDAVNTLKENLDLLASTKEFRPASINNFLFCARRSCTWLIGNLYTKYNNLAIALFNPSAKHAEQHPPEDLQNRIKKMGANKMSKSLYRDIEEEIIIKFPLQAQQIAPITVTSAKNTPSINILEQKMGTENYQDMKSKVIVNSPTDAMNYVNEEIYGLSFETIYSQVVKLQDILGKINLIAENENNVQNIINKKTQLLKKAGLEALIPDGVDFINALAAQLGFTNAEVLHQNYQALDTPEGLALFKKIKSEFVGFANKATSKEADPLEQVKIILAKEHESVKSKSSQGLNSSNYTMIVSYLAKDINLAIQSAQVKKNIIQVLTNDFLPNYKYGDFAFKFGGTMFDYKKHIENTMLGGLLKEAAALSKWQNEIAKPINTQYTKIMKSHIHKKNQNRKKILSNAPLSLLDSPSFINNYIEVTLANETFSRNFYEANALPADSPALILLEKKFKEHKEKYHDFKDAFDDSTARLIYGYTTEDPLNQIIDAQKTSIATLSQNIEKNQQIKEKLENKIQTKEASFIGTLTKWKDNIASFFGVKTTTIIKRENQAQELKELAKKIAVDNVTVNIHTDILNRASAQKKLIDRTRNLNVAQLMPYTTNLLNDLQNCYQQIKHDFETATIKDSKTDKIFEHQQKFKALENNCNIVINEFLAKLKFLKRPDNNMPPKEIELLYTKVSEAITLITAFKPTLSGTPKIAFLGALTDLKETLGGIIKDIQKASQQKLLDDAINQTTLHFQTFSQDKLNDPFAFIAPLINNLTHESKITLFQHIQQQATAMLNKTQSDQLSVKMLQNIYLQLQLVLNRVQTLEKTKEQASLVNHYQQIASQVKAKIDADYQKNMDLPFFQLKEKLSVLNTELVFFNSQYEQAQKDTQSLNKSYGSWLSNPIGLITENMIKQAKSNEIANRQQLEMFKGQYITFLKNYFEKSQLSFGILFEKELTDHIEMIKNNLIYLSQYAGTFNEAMILHEKILNAAYAALDAQAENKLLEASSDKELADLTSQYSELKNCTDIINKALISPISFTPTQFYEKYAEVLQTTQEKATLLEQLLQTLSLTYKNIKDPEKQLKVTLKQAQVKKIMQDVATNQQNYANQLKFYKKIENHEEVALKPGEFDKKVLGKALIIALTHHSKIVTFLLDPLLANEPIEISDLSNALILAAKQGELEVCKKILNYRQDINFNSAQIFEAVRAGFSKNHEVIQYLVLNTDFIPTQEAIEFIINHTQNGSSTLSEVNKGWKQTWQDADGPKLEKLRQWFTFQQQLLDSLKLSFDLIEKNTKPSPEDIQELLAKIEKIEKLNVLSQHYINNIYFENQQRKNEHLSKWQQEIETVIAKYKHTLQNIFKPPISLNDNLAKAPLPVIQDQNQALNEDKAQFEIASRALEAQISDSITTTPALQEFKITLNKLNHFAQTKNDLVMTLQGIINKLAASNQTQALDIALAECPGSHKQEMILSALSQAIDAGSVQTASLLIKKQAYLGHEDELLSKLLTLYQERIDGQLEKRHVHAASMAFLLLTHTPVTLLDPKTGQLDENIINLIENFTNDPGGSDMFPVSKNWWDNDYAKLEALRQTYIFAQKSYEQLTRDIYISLQPLNETDPSLLSEFEINAFAQQWDIINRGYLAQLQALEKLSTLYQNSRKNVKFDNISRRDQYMNDESTGWEITLANKKNECQKDIEKYLNEAKHNLEQLDVKPEMKDSVMRQSALFSQKHKISPHIKSNAISPDNNQFQPKKPSNS